MRYGIVLEGIALALALAWAPGATAQSGTPLAQRRLEGRVVSVDPQDHSVTVDWRHRLTGDELAAAAAPAWPAARRHGRDGRWAAPPPDPRAAAAMPSDPASTTKLELTPRATVVRDGLNVGADEVRPGDEVRASFLTDDLTRTHPWQLEVRSLHGREAPWGVGTGG